MRVCARCVCDHVHLQIIHRPVIARNAVTMPAHSQTVVCGLRNKGWNSKTRRGCKRQCRRMFALFAIRIKWHVVCVLPQPKMWVRKYFRRRHGQTKMTVSVRLHCWVLLSYDRTWKNMVHTSSNLCQTSMEQGLWHGEKRTGVLSHLVIRDVIMVWDTSKWFRILIKQNKKSWNGVLKSVPKNMWRWSSETWMVAHILKY